MNIAFLAHDKKKEEMIQFAKKYENDHNKDIEIISATKKVWSV